MTALTGGLLKLVAAGLVCCSLLTLSGKSAQTELLRFGCACLMVILLLSLLRQTEIPAFDLERYEAQVREAVTEAQEQVRRDQLEQTARALEQELERQAAAMGLTCTISVACAADEAGLVTVQQVLVHYSGGPRDRLRELQRTMAAQLAAEPQQIIIQEDTP